MDITQTALMATSKLTDTLKYSLTYVVTYFFIYLCTFSSHTTVLPIIAVFVRSMYFGAKSLVPPNISTGYKHCHQMESQHVRDAYH